MKGINKIILMLTALMLLIGTVMLGCAPGQPPTPGEEKPIELRWGASYVGTVMYMTAASLSPMIKEYTDGRILITVTPTRGSGDTAALLVAGEIDMGGVVPSVQYQLYNGTGIWEGKTPYREFTTLMNYTWSAVYWFVRADSDIRVISDLKGKKMLAPSPGSVGAIHAERLLRAAGLDPEKDVNLVLTSLSAQIEGLKDRTADVISLSLGWQAPGILELASTLPVRLMNVPPEVVLKVDNEYNGGTGLEYPQTIPMGAYPGQDEPGETLGYSNPAVVRPGIPDDVWYEIIKIAWEHKAELESRFAMNKTMNREQQSKYPSFAPLNPGVKRYYEEVGWTELSD